MSTQRFNTGNPIGSNSPLDRSDNTRNLDVAVLSSEDTFQDRLGQSRLTFAGMQSQFSLAQELRNSRFQIDQAERASEFDADQVSREQRFNTFIASSGYQFLGDYGPGIELTEYNQLVRDENGEFWRVSGQVDLPYVTTGAGIPEDDALVPAGDAVLRQDLANPDKGAAMVARGVVAVDSIDDLLALPEGQRKEGLRYLVKGYHAGTGVGGGGFFWDSFADKEDHDGGAVIDPAGPFPTDWSVATEVEDWFTPASSGTGCFRLIGEKVSISNFGAIKQDGLDQSRAIRQALENVEGKELVFTHDVHINPAKFGLPFAKISPNCKIVFTNNSAIKCLNSGSEIYEVLSLWPGSDNVTLVNPWVIGDRDVNSSTGGEWGHGISMRGVKNIRIYNGRSDRCWGDGYYIAGSGPEESYIESSNITLVDCSADGNRRQGISLIAGRDIKIIRPVMSNTEGTPPQAGIDIEPNDSWTPLSNILIKDLTAMGNAGASLAVYLLHANSSTEEISITVDGVVGDSHVVLDGRNISGASGRVTLKNIEITEPESHGLYVRYWDAGGPEAEVDGLTIVRPNTGNLNSPDYYPVRVGRAVGETGAPGMVFGNVRIRNWSVIDDRDVPLTRGYLHARDAHSEMRNVVIDSPVRLEGATVQPMVATNGVRIFDDKRLLVNVRAQSSSSGQLNTLAIPATYYRNDGSSPGALTEWVLPGPISAGWDMTFEVVAPDTSVRVIAPTGTSLSWPIGSSSITSSRVGSSVTLRFNHSTGIWIVQELIGEWRATKSTQVTDLEQIPLISAGGSYTFSATLPGAEVGDFLLCSSLIGTPAIILSAKVASQDTVAITIQNTSDQSFGDRAIRWYVERIARSALIF